MKKYKDTFDKIEADDELKKRIFSKASESSHKRVKTHSKLNRLKSIFNWHKAAAAVMAVVMAVSLTIAILQPWNNNGNDDGGNGGMTPKISAVVTPVTMKGEVTGVLSPACLSRDGLIEWIRRNAGVSTGDSESGSIIEESEKADESGASSPDGDRNDYATTNVQHEGVDEGDIIKVDNNYIYMLSQGGLVIVSIAEKMKVSFKIEYQNFYPDEMYIYGDRLIVIGGEYSQFYYGYNDIAVGEACVPWYGYRTNTKIVIYDLNNRVDVDLLTEYSITGNFLTSRLIENRLIVSVNHSVYGSDINTYFPKINGVEISTESINLYDTEGYNSYGYYGTQYTVIASLNLDSAELLYSAHLGLSGMTYFSKNNVYFFNTVYTYVSTNASIYDYYYYYSYQTVIVKIGLQDLLYVASQKIDGIVHDRYWADEYEGDLRLVSEYYSYTGYYNYSETKRYSEINIFDNELNLLGTVGDIAPGETIYSVRFNGKEASLVTFLQVDPLFKVDLSDRMNPTVSKGLKEEGVSDYLQYLSDDILLGLGRNAIVEGGWTRFEGMKISIYDNTGADAVNIKTINIGSGYAYSEALYEPKAILNDTAKNMFSFAVTMRGHSYFSVEGQGLMVFEYNLNAARNEDKLIYKGILSDIESNKTYSDWNDYYYDYFSYIKRGARIGNKIYTISDRYVTSYDIASLELVERLALYDDECGFMHNWTTIKTVNATCKTSGVLVQKCRVNPSHVEKHIIPAHGHSWSGWKIVEAPTATTSGKETRTCYYNSSHKETRKLVNAVGVKGLILEPSADDSQYNVRVYMGSSDTVVIPAYHKGKPIVAINDFAFENNPTLKSVTISKNITSIGYGAFSNASKLKSINFEQGSNLKTIGTNTFINCSSLKNISLPQSITSIGSYAFYGCSSLESIVIPQNVTSIGSYAFGFCSELQSVRIGKNVVYISDSAFVHNPLLANLTVDEGNTVYKSDKNCIIQISSSSLIVGCNSSIIPDYIKNISPFSFAGSGIQNITIPKSVEAIGYNAFSESSLQNVQFEQDSGLKVIDSYAFGYCYNIATIDIPESVIEVRYCAFQSWTDAQIINVYGVETEYDARVKFGANWRAGCWATVNYFSVIV